MALACFSCRSCKIYFFSATQLFKDLFAKKRRRNRHGWSDGTRRRDLEDLQNSTQRISASRGISGSERLSEWLSVDISGCERSLSVDIFGCNFEGTGLSLKISNTLADTGMINEAAQTTVQRNVRNLVVQ